MKLTDEDYQLVMDKIISKITFLKEHKELLNMFQWEETKDYWEVHVIMGVKKNE